MTNQIKAENDSANHDLETKDNSLALSKSYRLLLSLTFTGAIPFFFLALLLHIKWLPQATMLPFLFSYAAVILTFLGGIQWGIGMVRLEDKTLHYPHIFALSVLPSLAAWLLLLLDYPRLQLIGFMLCFAMVFGVDIRLYLEKILPRWFLVIRFSITLVVITLLLFCYSAIKN